MTFFRFRRFIDALIPVIPIKIFPMVKKFTIPCDFSGRKQMITFYIGNAAVGSHPIEFQSKWLSVDKGGTVPPELMQSFARLKEIADKNKIPFEELCSYVIEEINYTNNIKNITQKKK